MSRRRNPLTVRIRTLLREQRYEEARPLLAQLQEQDPQHPLLAAAQQCMENGVPLTVPQEPRTPRAAAQLQKDLAAFAAGETDLTRCSAARLRRLCRNDRAAANTLPDELRPYLPALRRAARAERSRRFRPLLQRGLAAVLLTATVAALYGVYHHLQERAESAADAMAAALANGSVRAEKRALLLHDAGLHRLFSRRVGFTADALRQRLQAQQTRREELETLLAALEAGEQRVSALPLRTRTTAEQTLAEQGEEARLLKQRWESCCEADAQALQEQKAELMEQLMAPLPPLPTMTELPEADIAALQTHLQRLKERRELLEEAEEAYIIPDAASQALQCAAADAKTLLIEVQQYQALTELLPSARSYAQFRSMLGDKNFRSYAPACRAAEQSRLLPDETAFLASMQAYGHGNSETENVARLLQGSPTFHAGNPATPEQVHVMEELFSNSALRLRLWEISTPGKPVVFTEEEPQVRGDSVRIRRSALDPQKRVADAEWLTWEHPENVLKRCIDTRPLAEAAMAERETFFNTAHLPAVLTAVLNTPAPCAPALARAYLYDVLLHLQELMDTPDTAGLRYSPTLQAHTADFRRMAAGLGIRLDGVCWLRTDAAARRAEERCAAWFRRHSGRDYAAEIRKTLTAHMNVEPLYCGYVNEAGTPVFCQEPRAGELLWYVSESGITYGKSVPSARPFTPLFLLRKR